jgi:hypothetical protein
LFTLTKKISFEKPLLIKCDAAEFFRSWGGA